MLEDHCPDSAYVTTQWEEDNWIKVDFQINIQYNKKREGYDSGGSEEHMSNALSYV